MPAAAVLLATALLAATAPQPPARPLYAPGPVRVDGHPRELKRAAPLAALAPESASGVGLVLRAGWRPEGLLVAVDVTDADVAQADGLTLALHFPEAGPTAPGYAFRFALDGPRAPPDGSLTPAWARALVKSAQHRTPEGWQLEVLVPARALPRFPAQRPLVLDLCASYEDAPAPPPEEDEDAARAEPPAASVVTTCPAGAPLGGPVRLPDAFRKGLGVTAPAGVVGLEGRPGGWAGYGLWSFPIWVQGDRPLTRDSLPPLVTDDPVDPQAARVYIPAALALPGGVRLLPVLAGRNPFSEEGTCEPDGELKLGLYRVRGRQAWRALEWPAATCALGWASSVELDEEGALRLGYSSGLTVNFAWSGDHFERTEIGKR